MRRKILTVAAVAMILVGAVASSALATRAFAGVNPWPGSPQMMQSQAAPAMPGTGCPFTNEDGSQNLDAMRQHMDSLHGPGSFGQMWGQMAPGAGSGSPGGMRGMMPGAPGAQ